MKKQIRKMLFNAFKYGTGITKHGVRKWYNPLSVALLNTVFQTVGRRQNLIIQYESVKGYAGEK